MVLVSGIVAVRREFFFYLVLTLFCCCDAQFLASCMLLAGWGAVCPLLVCVFLFPVQLERFLTSRVQVISLYTIYVEKRDRQRGRKEQPHLDGDDRERSRSANGVH